ncbi:hypothetical protein [uncultured Brevundimonas sp.]|uniref:hypothetical protein n=1 Tax=uncultured Brevundimonas sp. TaxID=213418 RepID=UPI0030EE3634|tara:strand:+ start:2501 stop:2782 length:282 start_codon:yes stop_codon:yes gene_type:complete
MTSLRSNTVSVFGASAIAVALLVAGTASASPQAASTPARPAVAASARPAVAASAASGNGSQATSGVDHRRHHRGNAARRNHASTSTATAPTKK